MQTERDAAEEANKVHGFDGHKSAVVPWLKRTGIAEHIQDLKKDEIRASIALPKNSDQEPELVAVLEGMEAILREAHSWCFDGPDCMLTWPRQVVLNRFQSSKVELLGKTRAFEPDKEASTLATYFGLWKQLLAYMYRVVDRDYFTTEGGQEQRQKRSKPEDVIHLSGEQWSAWEETLSAASAGDGSALKKALEALCIRLICHNVGGKRYSSPLVSFCAMLSVKPSTLGWMRPGDYSSHLSGLIWVVQLLVFHHSASQELRGSGGTLKSIKRICEKFLQQTAESPVGELLRWRLLLLRISKDDVGAHQARWDGDEQILTYDDTELRMDEVPKLLLSEYEQACELLYGELMFGAQQLPRTHAWALRDNLDCDAFGWFFGLHRENAGLLEGRDRALRTVIQNSKPLRDSFLAETDGGGRIWRDKAVALYETAADEFLKRLLVLIYIGAGQPLREPELFSVTWRNSQRRRNIFIQHGLIMLHTTYHKGQQQTGAYKDNIRFLPSAVGDLLLDYIVHVIPLRQSFLRQSAPKALISPYLWWKDGGVWADNRLTRSMEGACARAEVPRLHISNWRQMTVAIVKTKFAGELSCFDPDLADEDAEEIDEDIRIMTKQRNHTTRTVNRAYANQNNANFGNVWDGLIRRSLRASTLWKDLWGLDVVLKGKKRRASEEAKGPAMMKKIAMGVYRPKKAWSPAALLGGVRRLHGKEDMTWRSPEQQRAMTTIMSWTEQVLVILPTGSGKSLLFMLPYTLPDAGVTVLVVPLVSLRGDLLRRLRELDIDHLVWLPGETREAGLVLVTAEAASTKDFMAYAQRLVVSQRLDRIVIDECHLAITAAEYRESMVDLAVIRSLRTQFVYLTATLPPAIQAEFEEQNHLLNPKVIRASSNRPNLFYVVRRAGRRGNLLEQSAYEAQEAWRSSGLFDHSRDKIILYARTRAEADELSRLLGCAVYTAKIGTTTEKEEVLRKWISSPDQPYMVATTALGAGFDHPYVRLVMHVNEPDSIIDFAQESGRAGRDGQRAYSFVMLPASWEPRQEPHPAESIEAWESTGRDAGLRKKRERKMMHEYLKGDRCFRTCLSEYLDLPAQRRWCMKEDVACDVCKVSHDEAVPPPVERAKGEEAKTYTGAGMIQRERQEAYLELSRYREDLS